MKIYEGELTAKGKKFGIVVSRFNEFITKRLLDGALDKLKRQGVDGANVEVTWVPGSFEVPFFCQKLAQSKKYDAIIALSAVLRGDTPHFDFVATELAKGIAKVSLDTGVPVSFGAITADSMEQAIERAGAKSGNKGAHAAETAIETVNLVSRLRKK